MARGATRVCGSCGPACQGHWCCEGIQPVRAGAAGACAVGWMCGLWWLRTCGRLIWGGGGLAPQAPSLSLRALRVMTTTRVPAHVLARRRAALGQHRCGRAAAATRAAAAATDCTSQSPTTQVGNDPSWHGFSQTAVAARVGATAAAVARVPPTPPPRWWLARRLGSCACTMYGRRARWRGVGCSGATGRCEWWRPTGPSGVGLPARNEALCGASEAARIQ